ncbi:D-glycero-beta-D-manno-heptose 1,7-bisphosphate 7-phosphatase [Candidatus Bipolaricaulota bacterium]|nr:D-glycero-beta-D-manno-heptose 1,7-bisphosphate 7-phosphatase [Candidatus Bipolaricaulota bacterium]
MTPRSDSNHAPPFVQRGGAVLLDRDGVINQQTAFVNVPDDLVLVEGAATAIARLNEAGWPVAIITNQGGIAMGYLTEDMLHKIHERMEQLLTEENAHVDAIFYCAHHEHAKLPEYKLNCQCRKPNIGMLEQARDKLDIELSKSVVVGDRTTDILAGIRAGCSTILVQTGAAGKDREIVAEPDTVVADISVAVDLILSPLKFEGT